MWAVSSAVNTSFLCLLSQKWWQTWSRVYREWLTPWHNGHGSVSDFCIIIWIEHRCLKRGDSQCPFQLCTLAPEFTYNNPHVCKQHAPQLRNCPGFFGWIYDSMFPHHLCKTTSYRVSTIKNFVFWGLWALECNASTHQGRWFCSNSTCVGFRSLLLAWPTAKSLAQHIFNFWV